MNSLQKSLLANTIFSSTSGLFLAFFSEYFNALFQLNNPLAFQITGYLLIFFALTIVLEIKKQRYYGVLWIVIQDVLWVLGSIILLVIDPFGVSQTGNQLIVLVALIVAGLALIQYIFLRKKYSNSATGGSKTVI